MPETGQKQQQQQRKRPVLGAADAVEAVEATAAVRKVVKWTVEVKMVTMRGPAMSASCFEQRLRSSAARLAVTALDSEGGSEPKVLYACSCGQVL